MSKIFVKRFPSDTPVEAYGPDSPPSGFVKTDQTTPQTITGGRPILDAGVDIGTKGIKATASKGKLTLQGNQVGTPHLIFNGTDSAVNIVNDNSNNAIFGATSFSIEWLGIVNTSGESFGRIVDKSDSASIVKGYRLRTTASGFDFTITDGAQKNTVTNGGYWTSGVLVHVVVVWTSGSASKIYINGVEATYSQAQAITTPSDDTPYGLCIGNRTGATDRTFDGSMNHLRIYRNHALTISEIQALYHGLKVSGANAEYLFSEGTGTSIADTGTGNHAGTASNCTWGTTVIDENLNIDFETPNKIIVSSDTGVAEINLDGIDLFTSGKDTASDFQSLAPSGTPPYKCNSSTVNPNLNADLVDGQHAAAFQSTLVSGTNIKTVNGNTLLGSGDLPVVVGPVGADTQIQYNNGGVTAGTDKARVMASGIRMAVESGIVPFVTGTNIIGDVYNQFSQMMLYGVNAKNSNNGNLYCVFSASDNIWLNFYNGSELVARSEPLADGAGMYSIYGMNNSGIFGRVWYAGTGLGADFNVEPLYIVGDANGQIAELQLRDCPYAIMYPILYASDSGVIDIYSDAGHSVIVAYAAAGPFSTVALYIADAGSWSGFVNFPLATFTENMNIVVSNFANLSFVVPDFDGQLIRDSQNGKLMMANNGFWERVQ